MSPGRSEDQVHRYVTPPPVARPSSRQPGRKQLHLPGYWLQSVQVYRIEDPGVPLYRTVHIHSPQSALVVETITGLLALHVPKTDDQQNADAHRPVRPNSPMLDLKNLLR